MTKVREKMTTDPVVLEGTTTIADAARHMRDHDIGDVLVRIDGSYGICTDRDIVLRAVAEEKAPTSVTLGDVATRDLETVSPDADLEQVIRDMDERNVRRIPVCEDGSAVGILSIGDLAVMRDADSLLADISAAESNN